MTKERYIPQHRNHHPDEFTYNERYRSQWAEYIQAFWNQTFPEVELNQQEIENAVDVLQEFERGMYAMEDEAITRDLIPEENPKAQLSLSTKIVIELPFAWYVPKKRQIKISLYYLFPEKIPHQEKIKKAILERIKIIEGKVFIKFRETFLELSDAAFLFGIHEYLHHLEPEEDSLVNSPSTAKTQAQFETYIMQNNEYQAFSWMLFFAKKYNYAPDVIKQLEDIVSLATNLRKKNGVE